MLYSEYNVVFEEVPGEVTLAVNIAGCPVRCPGCHSPWLWKDEGRPLDEGVLARLVARCEGVTCVALMGGDGEPDAVARLLMSVRRAYPKLKTCWYSGRDMATALRHVGPAALDYLKVGPYDAARGGLASPATNQRMYRVVRGEGRDGQPVYRHEDITSLFWKKH